MKKQRKRILGIVLVILFAAGAVASGWMLHRAPQASILKRWNGVLTLWVIDGEEMAAIARSRAAAFTRRYPNIHVLVRPMEGKTAALYLNGEQGVNPALLPDLLAFSSGVVQKPQTQLMPLSLPEGVNPAADAMVSVEGTPYAVPVMMQLPAMAGQSMPDTPEALLELIRKPVGKRGPRAFEGNAAALIAALCGPDATPILPDEDEALKEAPADDGYALSRAVRGNTRLFVGSASQARRSVAAGSLAAALPMGELGALMPIRLWCVGMINRAQPEPERLAAMQRFLGILLEEGAQRSAENWGYFPVMPLKPELDENGNAKPKSDLDTALIRQLEGRVAVPSVFEPAEQAVQRQAAAVGILTGKAGSAEQWAALWPGVEIVPKAASEVFWASAKAP